LVALLLQLDFQLFLLLGFVAVLLQLDLEEVDALGQFAGGLGVEFAALLFDELVLLLFYFGNLLVILLLHLEQQLQLQLHLVLRHLLQHLLLLRDAVLNRLDLCLHAFLPPHELVCMLVELLVEVQVLLLVELLDD